MADDLVRRAVLERLAAIPVGIVFGHLLSGFVLGVLPEAPPVPTPTSAAP